MIFSCLAYFLVENKESEDAENKLTCTIERIFNSVYFFFTGNKNSKGIESETTNLEDNDQVTSTRLSNDR